MKKQVTQKKSFNKKPGFTLVEVAIAIGMMAVMISSFMVVFGPSIKGIDKSLSAKEADRLTGALELELSVLRNGEKPNDPGTNDKFATTFEKAFWWIRDSARTDADRHPVLIYQYRGNPNNVRDDGTLEPLYDNGNQYDPDDPDVAGVDYVIQTSARRLKDTFHTGKISEELYTGNLVGKIYYVKMRQLRYDTNGVMVETTAPGDVTQLNLVSGSYPSTDMPDDYDEDAVLPFRAYFYEVKPPMWSVVGAAAYNPANTLTNPVITKNMAVMR